MIPYDPTPEEIAAACAEIRAGWSDGEKRRRSAWAVTEPWEVPAVDGFEVEDSST